MFTRILAAATLAVIAPLSLAAPAVAQTAAADARFRAAQERFDREYQLYRQEADRYQAVRSGYADPRAYQNSDPRYAPRVADPRYADNGYADDEPYYDPRADYRAGNQYRERVLSNDERVYAGTDGRYYCKRNDGTTGLIIGGAAGGILGNVIDGGRSRIVGTLLGGAAGAFAGRAVDQSGSNAIRCR